jgi:hypothetical protein
MYQLWGRDHPSHWPESRSLWGWGVHLTQARWDDPDLDPVRPDDGMTTVSEPGVLHVNVQRYCRTTTGQAGTDRGGR